MKVLSVALLALYFVVMFPLLHRLDRLGNYASYFFELAFIVITGFLVRRRLGFRIPGWESTAPDLGLGLLGGFIAYKLAAPLGLPIPFDLSSGETILLLLLIGPLIEELVFRMALWELFSEFIHGRAAILIWTSAVFSFAHFFAWFSVPAELHGFVIYQTFYTFGLGLYCGWRKQRTGSMVAPVLVHMAFNLGFLFGFQS